jgi:type I restriction enzyme S subunit
MGNKWPTLPLEELVENIFDRRGVTPTKLGSDFISAGNRVISAKLIKGSRIDLSADEPRFVNAATYKKWMSSPLQEDDVIMTSEAPLGELALVRQKLEWCLGQRLFGIRTDKKKLNGRFLFYALQSETVRNDLISRATGTTVTGIRQSELRKVAIPLPPLPEQKRIAGILGALDDKIELNRKMNETLEQMAKALFKSWFVDFDPVQAKATGSQPAGIDKNTADLFPDKFADSELGKIPKGWSVASFAEHMEAVRGLSYNGDGLTSEGMGLPMHNLNSVYEGGGYKHEGLKFYNGEFKEKHVIRPGDMIVTNTEQGFDHLLIGHAAIVPSRYGDRGIFSHHLYRVRPKSTSPFTAYYLVQLFNNPRWHYWISGFSNGTTINMLPLDALEMPKLVVPPAELVLKFSESAKALDDKFEENLKEIKALTGLRDTLLPQLLGGELPSESR